MARSGDRSDLLAVGLRSGPTRDPSAWEISEDATWVAAAPTATAQPLASSTSGTLAWFTEFCWPRFRSAMWMTWFRMFSSGHYAAFNAARNRKLWRMARNHRSQYGA